MELSDGKEAPIQTKKLPVTHRHWVDKTVGHDDLELLHQAVVGNLAATAGTGPH